MKIEKKYLYETINKVQRCQRNWDLNKQIPKEDLDLIIHSALNCPSKQNRSFFNLHVISNREKIEDIYEESIVESGSRKNPQILANVLLVFTGKKLKDMISQGIPYHKFPEEDFLNDKHKIHIYKDINICAGIAAGFTCFTAGLLGYETGFCKCFNDQQAVKLILGTDEDILLSLGIGFKDESMNRQRDHVTKLMIESFDKNHKIEIYYHD